MPVTSQQLLDSQPRVMIFKVGPDMDLSSVKNLDSFLSWLWDFEPEDYFCHSLSFLSCKIIAPS